MRYLVFGTGAVGGLIGARLVISGQSVVFLARRPVAAALRRDGLCLEGDGLRQRIPPPTVLEEPADIARLDVPPDAVLLCVKAYDTAQAADYLSRYLPGSAPILCFSNGVGSEQVLASRLGKDRVVAAALTTAVSVVEPGLVRIERERGIDLVLGHHLLPILRQELQAAGFRLRLHDDADRLKWSKLMTNIVANATSAITGWLPGAVFSHPGLYRLEVEALREVVRLLRAMGHAPENLVGVPVRWLSRALSLPPRWVQPLLRRSVAGGRGQKLPSFHQDIGRGRSEVLWLNGAVVDHARAQNLPAPANAVLTEILLGLVEGRLDPADYRDRPEMLLAAAAAAGVPGLRGYNALSREGRGR